MRRSNTALMSHKQLLMKVKTPMPEDPDDSAFLDWRTTTTVRVETKTLLTRKLKKTDGLAEEVAAGKNETRHLRISDENL